MKQKSVSCGEYVYKLDDHEQKIALICFSA